ncbi:glucose-6-phosphate dehydrogenase [Agrococcus versicolor]|uniref:Glucose-6-phosphate dehydrogenase n=1 Tax=Agrococcus versicolor TaxID=501482 RepID=A0ABN3APA4_9MICO
MRARPGIPSADDLEQRGRTIAILGAGGDLTERLLLPGLGEVAQLARLDDVTLIGAARTPQTDEEWQGVVRGSLESAGIAAHVVDALTSGARFVATDASDPEQLRALLDACPTSPVLYVALPPAMGHAVAASLAEIDLPDDLVVAIEKPFGEDLSDARALNEAFAAVLPEDRLWRIDHFLGNQAVVGMLGLRFGNPLLEASWSAEHVERVEIVYDETLGVEGRAAFYDGTGALRDMLQSHLLMVLAAVAMERPDAVTAADVHVRMAEVLGATRLWRDDPGAARRARYEEGRVEGRLLPSYVDEEGVDADARAETLAQLVLQVDVPRWQGVPFVLRSGKAIGDPRAEIAIHLRAATPLEGIAVPADGAGSVLRISLEDAAIDVELLVDDPGHAHVLAPLGATARPAAAPLSAYGQVLLGLLAGDRLLSVPGDVAEQCWRIVTPVLDAWAAGDGELEAYEAGSGGPSAW